MDIQNVPDSSQGQHPARDPIAENATEQASRQSRADRQEQPEHSQESQERSGDRYDRSDHAVPVPVPGYGDRSADVPSAAGNRPPASGLSLLMGRISLDLSYQRTTVQQSGNGFQTSMRSESLSIDFSFLQAVVGEGAMEVGPNYDAFLKSGVVKDFITSSMKLDFADDASLKEFNQSVDALFNKLEETLGLSSDRLDYVQDTFKDSVAGFFDRVQEDLTQLPGGVSQLPAERSDAPDLNGLRPLGADEVKGGLFRDMGRLFDALGDRSTAKNFFERARELDPASRFMNFINDFLARREALALDEVAKIEDAPNASGVQKPIVESVV